MSSRFSSPLQEVQEALERDWAIKSTISRGAEMLYGGGLYATDEWGELIATVIRTDIFVIKFEDGREEKWCDISEPELAASIVCEAFYELHELGS